MGQILEAQVEVDVRGLLTLFDQEAGFFQASLYEPAAGSLPKDVGKVSFEGRKATTGQIGKTVDAYVELVVFVHERFQVDFLGLSEVEQEGGQAGVRSEED